MSRPLLVGAFSAASNVTGLLTDVDAVTLLLHQHGALALWDYASAAPYLPVQMNPPAADAAHAALLAKDAIFFSPHKLAGGPQTPGGPTPRDSPPHHPMHRPPATTCTARPPPHAPPARHPARQACWCSRRSSRAAAPRRHRAAAPSSS